MVIGSVIGHYKIVEKLGEGGMGVVYKAEDTQLRRTVALKFLPRETLDEEDIKARLIREAQAAAALDHPNICQVFGMHEDQGETFIAMAFIDGPSLAHKIKERPLRLDEALDVTAQIAGALHEAHEQGVVHRDIKPQNILLTGKGQVKILDFGLASLTGRSKLTKTGTTLGTPAYMAPEQLEGGEVDHRADVWALGCVLYEMLTQKTPFDAEYEQAIGYGILNEEPEPATALRSGLPTEVDRLIGKALAKDPAERYQHADDLLADLRVLQRQSGERKKSSGSSMALPASQRAVDALPPGAVVVQRSRLRALQALAVVFAVALLSLTAVHLAESPTDERLRRFSFVPPSDIAINRVAQTVSLAISPSGMHIAYVASGDAGGLWVQHLDQDEPRRLAGTEGAAQPFWSPDSEFIAYVARGELRKISVRGGASALVCPLPALFFFGGTWGPDGESIVFSAYDRNRRRLYRASSQGGSPEELIAPGEFDEAATEASSPRFVLGASEPILLFTIGTAGSGEMYARNLNSGQTAALGSGAHAVYSPSTGHLIYESGGGVSDLWARPFSPQTLEFAGSAFPLRQNARQPSVSYRGTLAFLDGTIGGARSLAWRSRTGELLETVGQPQPAMGQPALSADDQRVAVRSAESGNQDIWVHDLARSTKTRLTFEEQSEAFPAWSPSGEEIAYRYVGAPNRILRRAADGTGAADVLLESENVMSAPGWSRDGRYFVYYEVNPETLRDIRYVQLGNDGQPGETVVFLASPANEQFPKLSPNGRFLAYASDESGRNEVYVRLFPGGSGKWLVSATGGNQPRWSPAGDELYYVEPGTSTLVAVPVSTAQGFTLGQPQALFADSNLTATGGGVQYDVSADGQRFLTVVPFEGPGEETPKIRLVQNWYEEFRERGR